MTARIIDGKQLAAQTRSRVAAEVARIATAYNVIPALAVVLVGDDAASQVYIASKKKMTAETGMKSFDHHLPATASEAELLALIGKLNADSLVTGVLV